MRCGFATLLSLICLNGYANVIQYFSGISYKNPADLYKINSNEFIIGATGFNTNARFQGTQLNFNTFHYDSGVSRSITTSLLPYGRIAGRFNEKWVFGVDVTQPFHSNLNWGDQSFTRYAATQTYLTDIDVSPRASYKINDYWVAGAGLNFNFLKNNETNWALPTGLASSANLINRTSGFGLGFNLGITHMLNPTNFVGLSYYSPIKQKTSGSSTFTNHINSDLRFNFTMPGTTILNYVHIFNPSWLASMNLFYVQWDANQYAVFKNTSAQPPLDNNFTFTMKFRPSVAFLAAVRHQLLEEIGITALGMIDDGPERDEYRTINFPADTQYFLGLAADYHPNKTTTLELLYGYGFSNTKMNNHLTLNGQQFPFTTGKARIYANVLDLKLKIKT